MQLTMTVLRCPDSVVPETRNVSGGEYSVGRGPGVDWILPDPERLLSKRHFALAFRGGVWQLADTSTNGTFINREENAIGAGDIRSLRDGDRVRVGAYEIEVRLTEDAVARPGSAGNSPFADPFGMDPFAGKREVRNPFDEPDHPSIRITSAQLPPDFDPLMPERHEAPFRGPTQADHSPAMQDAFNLSNQVEQMPLHAGGVIPGDDLLPDDWDKDLLEGIAPAGAPAPAQAAPPRPCRPRSPPGRPSRHRRHCRLLHRRKPSRRRNPRSSNPRMNARRAAPPPPVAPIARRPAPPQPPPEPMVADDGALLAAFLEGAGMQDTPPKDPPAAMLSLGKAFRNMVAGLRAVMMGRAAIKSEFRIEQTMIQARGNNPLKFSAGDDDALAALLGAGRRSDMAAHEAVADALRDIRLHELATIAAMQTAVRSVLEGLDPAKLRARGRTQRWHDLAAGTEKGARMGRL